MKECGGTKSWTLLYSIKEAALSWRICSCKPLVFSKDGDKVLVSQHSTDYYSLFLGIIQRQRVSNMLKLTVCPINLQQLFVWGAFMSPTVILFCDTDQDLKPQDYFLLLLLYLSHLPCLLACLYQDLQIDGIRNLNIYFLLGEVYLDFAERLLITVTSILLYQDVWYLYMPLLWCIIDTIRGQKEETGELKSLQLDTAGRSKSFKFFWCVY